MTLHAIPRGPAQHLRLNLLGIAAILAEWIGPEGPEFLAEYSEEIAAIAGRPLSTATWMADVAGWAAIGQTTPLDRLAAALDDRLAIDILLTIGLVAEDPRIGAMLGENSRITVGNLTGLWRARLGGDDPQAVRRAIGRLMTLGLVSALDPEAPRLDQALAVPTAVWDALGGETTPPAGCRYTAVDALPVLDALTLPPDTARHAALLAVALQDEPDLVVALRGPKRNGRRTLAGALAQAIGCPLLFADTATPEAWQRAGLFAFLHDAVVVTAPTLAPGETRDVPAFDLAPVRLIVVTGNGGGIRTGDRPQTTMTLPMPGLIERTRHWHAVLPEADAASVSRLAASFQLTSGTIWRAVRGAAILARHAGRAIPIPADVRLALRDLQDSRLETIAARVETGVVGEFLALDDTTRDELDALAMRCRNREALAAHAGHGVGALGVRALFAGPSGAGKTLAARRLASDLARDIWRIDLSATVSKYIGETEKALDRAFAAAEELDAILLIDEGDALMAKRTDVGNANDRYANLETNFLLQRIEAFSGILLVTTNAADRIDAAFSRRMDAVVQFRAPDELRRYEILDRHLGDHRASDDLVQEIAVRCSLSGGQLRNVALHARLLSIDRNRPIGDHELREALVREYRKTDAHCPLKPLLSAVG